MNNDKLMDAMGMIDEDYVADARSAVRTRRSPAKMMLAFAAALILVFAVSLTAMAAADVGEAYDLLYNFSPTVAQLVRPVNMSCVENGIRMEVISAEISGSDAYVYISMEDLTGDRIDSTIDLYDSYDINRSFDCAAYCERIGYDEETGKALFLIHMQTMDKSRSIRGGKITFSVREMLSKKTVIDQILPVDLTQAIDPAETQFIDPERLRGTGSNGKTPDSYEFLAQREGGVYTPGDGAQITAMGYIDGRLHIQMRFDICRDGKWYYDNHGFLTLLDPMGEEIMMDYFEFWGGDMVMRKTDYQILQCHECFYQEYIIDIPPEELSRYSLRGDFCLCDTLIEGDWDVTFNLD